MEGSERSEGGRNEEEEHQEERRGVAVHLHEAFHEVLGVGQIHGHH